MVGYGWERFWVRWVGYYLGFVVSFGYRDGRKGILSIKDSNSKGVEVV